MKQRLKDTSSKPQATTFDNISRDHPDTAYDWFENNKDWVMLDSDSLVNIGNLYPKKGWSGPFLLAVPKLNGKIVKILGRAGVLEKTQANYLKLIQSLEN